MMQVMGTDTTGKTNIICRLESPYKRQVEVNIQLEFKDDRWCVRVVDHDSESLLFILEIRNDFGVESELPKECNGSFFASDVLWYLTQQLLRRQSHICPYPPRLYTEQNEKPTPKSELPTPASELSTMRSGKLAAEILRVRRHPSVGKMSRSCRVYVSQLVSLQLICGVRVPCGVVISTNSSSEIQVKLYWQTSDGLVSFFTLAVTTDVQNGRLTLHIADLAYRNSTELKGLLPKGIGGFALLFTQELSYALAGFQPITEAIFITVSSLWHAPHDINFGEYELFRDTGKTYYMKYGFLPASVPGSWDHSTDVIPISIHEWLQNMKTRYYQPCRPAKYVMRMPLPDQPAERLCYNTSSTTYTIQLLDHYTCGKNIENGHLKVRQLSMEEVSVKRQRLS